MRIYFVFMFSFFWVINTLFAEIKVYTIPKELYYSLHNDNFTVKVRHPGEEWIDLYEYNVKVDMDTNSDASMVYFDFSGEVEVMVQKNNGEIRSAVVRPLAKNIQPSLHDNTITFTLDKPQNLSVECNGDRLHNLHLFAGSIETDIPDKNAPDVMYFEAGFHKPDSASKESFKIPSNTTVYLEGGAVLNGRLLCQDVENVVIRGRGILFEPQQGVAIHHSRNITVDGIIAIDPRHYTVSGGESRGITIRNLKSFSYQGWSDGLDFMSCTDVLIDGVFMRNSDDCIAVYNHRGNFWGGSHNFLVGNSTLWADVAHPINIGTHGNTETGDEVMENLTFHNIDILEHDEDDRDYQGCMTINVGDHNIGRNILFEDIRVERIEEGQLFHLRVMYNEKYNTGPGKGIENITFRNITYTGYNENPSVIKGYSAECGIRNVIFENIVINGKQIRSPEEGNMLIGNFAKDILLKDPTD